RLQVAQVARPHRGGRRGGPRLLGAAGVPRGRLGRGAQRPGRRAPLVTATPPDAAAGRPGAGWIERFTPATRALHWATATLVLTCALTGFSLYVGSVRAIVGPREGVR